MGLRCDEADDLDGDLVLRTTVVAHAETTIKTQVGLERDDVSAVRVPV